METIKSIFDFLTGLGSPVMLPIIIFILGLILGRKLVAHSSRPLQSV